VTLYLDSSSIVKLYVEEPGAEAVAGLVAVAALVATSALAFPEVRAAFARRRRERTMTPRELAAARGQFGLDWSAMLVIPMDAALAERAGALAESHAIRGADAVHLAAFERLLSAADDEDIRFSCADDRLTRAARRLG
jgi:predicted nucleic acid-binding protein